MRCKFMRKENRTYYFSVEGKTELWYLEWLQQRINAEENAKMTVKLDVKVQKNPFDRVKRLTMISKTEITHIFDYESNEEQHVKQFKSVIDNMKKAQNSGKNVKYNLGYSNFTFELWLILHRSQPLNHRNQYLTLLNRAFHENFENLEQVKQEKQFKRILAALDLNDVRSAIQRSKKMMENNRTAGYKLQQYKGYAYYRENPSLSIWEQIERILVECGLQ